jgi:hypothetical protein
MMRLLMAAVIILPLAWVGCDNRRGQVPPRPGQSSAELAAAAEVLQQTCQSLALVEMETLGSDGRATHRSVGAVLSDDGHILAPAGAIIAAPGDGEASGPVYTRSITVTLKAGHPDERRYEATVVRESADLGLALLQIDAEGLKTIPLGDDLADDAEVYLIASPMGMSRLAAFAGTVLGYEETEAGRVLRHDAGGSAAGAGPVVDRQGRLVGMLSAPSHGDGEAAVAVPSVEVAEWLESPAEETNAELERLLAPSGVAYHPAEECGFSVPYEGGLEVRVAQRDDLIVATVTLGALEPTMGLEALRFNYTDPVGALALDDGELLWIARIPTAAATPEYIRLLTDVGVTQASRWEEVVAGQESDPPYGLYPGGEESAVKDRLASVLSQTGLDYAAQENGHVIQPEAEVPVYLSTYLGMVWAYAFSGGMPGSTEAEKEQNARELLLRNATTMLGRLSLDSYDDLAWEIQVPHERLTPNYLENLVRIGVREVSAVKSIYGYVPFFQNSQ